MYLLYLCLTHSNEYTRTLHCLSASLNRPMSMSMISFLRTISFTKHLHCFASFEFYWFTYIFANLRRHWSYVLAKTIKFASYYFSFPGSLRLPGAEEPGAGSPHGGPQGDHTQDPLRAVQVSRTGPSPQISHVICLIRFDKLREMMGGPRDYRVSWKWHTFEYLLIKWRFCACNTSFLG